MNTFFRQKLTNKTIDLLEKVEDRKTREEEDECFVLESPTILIIVGLPALIILGMILPIFAIREGYYAGGTVVMLIFCGIGGWLTGYALFWKVVITHEKVEYHSSFFGIKRSYLLKDITKVCYNELKELKVYKGKRKVFMVSSGTYGMDELVEWFREEGVLVEDNTPREEYYKVMLHTEKAWFYIIVLNVLAFTPAIVVILYYMHRDIPLETTREVFEAIVSYIVMIGMYIATWVAVVGEKTFYLKYQDGKYSYHRLFHKEKPFELDERITYKAREDGIVIYQDGKRLFVTFHGYTNAEFFGRTLLEKNIKCIKGEQYMEKYRDKDQEEI